VKQGKGRRSGDRAKVAKRVRVVEAREMAVRARERAAKERAQAVKARERLLAQRDALANERDRLALERDAMAMERDRAAAEREASRTGRAGRVAVLDVAPTAEAEDPDLERARLEAQLQRAHLDSLTGVLRREVGRLALRNEIERARRGDSRFVLAFIDVDGLKGVNDRDGHAAGDRVLRTLAATMRANLRPYDPIVRYGGDEFVCGVATIDLSEVEHRIAVIDQSLRNATGVGITAGLASMRGNETLEELTERADAALLEAKRARAS
jgi:diguanylate cyclase (GGDEF)-like protein